MKRLFSLFLLGASILAAQSYCNTPADNGRAYEDFNGVWRICFYQQTLPTPSSATTTYNVPTMRTEGHAYWKKFVLTFIANATADCTTAGGCITVNSGPSVPAAAALTQTVNLLDSHDVYVQQIRVRTLSACSGAATILLTGVGDTISSSTRYVSAATFDLTAAASSTNFAFLTIAHPFTTAIGNDTVTTTITTTTNDVNAIAAGCSFDLQFLLAPMVE